MDCENSFDALGPDGPVSRHLPGFQPRLSQRELAAQIEQAFADQELFVAESGTGTGKTLAYLVPALLSGKRVLISTGTRNLQDQLFNRDLPLVRTALGLSSSVALLKGRANYLCRQRLRNAQGDARLGGRRDANAFALVQAWAGRTRTGDIAEVAGVSEDSGVWPLVTSTPDNCLGGDCPDFDACFLNRARREALKADVLVVNHHLFFADLALREEGFGQLLPGVEAVIFDEAHQLPDVATRFFGQTLSAHQLSELCHDAEIAERKEASGVGGLLQAIDALEKATAELRLAFGVDARRAPLASVSGKPGVAAALAGIRDRLAALCELLELAAPKGELLFNANRRAGELLGRYYAIADGAPEHLAWFETTARNVFLHLTPMNVATPFRAHLEAGAKTWVFTSATLAVGEDFSHFQSQLGLEAARCARWESPFDYPNQALLYLPTGLPEPASPDFTAEVVTAAVPVLRASRGRAFFLFTSHRALQLAAGLLAGRVPFPLLVQGSAPRAQLLERFRSLDNAVLLGSASFWEGVDVRGDALSCVIIDKLPFASPDDPVLQARAEAMTAAGRNPFREFQIPSAVIALKQGVGRLIRDAGDRGVLMLCDPRLATKGYGKIFLASLPPMRRTRDIADVEAFFDSRISPAVAS